MMLFLNYYNFSGSAEALVRCGVGNYSIYWLLTFLVTHVPNIMKIRQCFLELWPKMSGMFFWDTVYIKFGEEDRPEFSLRLNLSYTFGWASFGRRRLGDYSLVVTKEHTGKPSRLSLGGRTTATQQVADRITKCLHFDLSAVQATLSHWKPKVAKSPVFFWRSPWATAGYFSRGGQIRGLPPPQRSSGAGAWQRHVLKIMHKHFVCLDSTTFISYWCTKPHYSISRWGKCPPPRPCLRDPWRSRILASVRVVTLLVFL